MGISYAAAGGSPKEEIVLDFRLHGKGSDRISGVRVSLDGETLYEDRQVPKDLSLSVADLLRPSCEPSGDHR